MQTKDLLTAKTLEATQAAFGFEALSLSIYASAYANIRDDMIDTPGTVCSPDLVNVGIAPYFITFGGQGIIGATTPVWHWIQLKMTVFGPSINMLQSRASLVLVDSQVVGKQVSVPGK